MATEKLYIAKLESGEELGPLDQDALVKLAEEGTITPKTLIRSKLIPDWNKSGNVDFLKAIIFRQQQAEMEAMVKSKPLHQKLLERIMLVAPEPEQRGKQSQAKPTSLPAPSPMFRLLAGIIDLVIVLLLAMGVLAVGKTCLSRGILLNDSNAVYITVSGMLTTVLMYFTLCMGGLGRTLGQRFWGIFLIRNNGKPLRMFRAFIYSLFLVLFGLFSPIFFVLHAKTYPELFTGTRFAKLPPKKKR